MGNWQLLAAGVPERYLYQDVASEAKQARPGLAACLKALHLGDTLVVWKLDRVARSLLHLLEMMPDLQERQVRLQILEGVGAQMNPATSEGKLFLSMLGAFANSSAPSFVSGWLPAWSRPAPGGTKAADAPSCRQPSTVRSRC